ncbi:transcriptional regulator [Pseudomonas brenneri]|uniref:LexA family transcriptional regulator n=1 Tax=Pseudomonas brenneri TaxID=129817 RepID=A0A5B2UJW6_9PSED|nr:LexA family transcriptional regulator [Pseudomonas brenneri]KAA2226762.1 LexA family transcriptional regulator [Pseudomonas brenneri]TWR74835.1 LexA family transcriptional regulator [Pseudomonas brenneri]GGL61678.1 transcriptional regulator [Pseudomonas brenneri]SDU90639.1 Phage repressor protein C, contains Cro/C1-type HTH and peptisase s24 domains [Pseudomonas brenneri]
MKIGERLAAEMERLGLSEGELGRRSGVNQPTIHRIITGDSKNPRQDNVEKIAKALGVTSDWLWRGDREKGTNVVSANFANRAKGEIDIPQYDVVGSMGPGQVAPGDYIETIKNITVRTEYLREQGVHYSRVENLAVITGFGESMEITFTSGDPLIIDKGVNEVLVDGVYLFSLDDVLYIKRLQRLPRMIRMISDNDAFPPYDIKGSELELLRVHARVLLAWNSKKL